MQVRLSASNLACRRGGRLLFRGLDFETTQGNALHITGANGIGKTSLLRILAGLLRPYAGAVAATGSIGLLDERPGLDPDLPLGKTLAFWERIDGCAAPQQAVTAMELESLLDVPVRYLSTGQKKRGALAALIHRNVPIWLLDEPLSGLDKSAIKRVTSLIAAHVSEGGIAIIASHQPLMIEGLETLQMADFLPHPLTEAQDA